MTRVVFLQRSQEEWLGVMYLSAMLKARGHECDVFVEPLEREDVAELALASRPGIVAFSCLTWDFPWALEHARRLKAADPSLLVVLGGTHVTLNPEAAIAAPEVDVICRGEGEHPLAELADALAAGRPFHEIPNLWVRHQDGTVTRNDLRNLVTDLDSLPFPDRGLYAKYAHFRELGARRLHLGRGCPYSCTYCHNESKREVFRGKGPYVRWRSQEGVLAEIAELRRDPRLRVLHFVDDSLGVNGEWFIGLLRRLSQDGIDRPSLQGSMRADMLTEELAAALAEYGPEKLRLKFAVECGDEHYRHEVLRKRIDNAALLRAARLLRERGIPFDTYNIVGFPGETLEQAFATLELNLRLRPRLAICFVLQPFPGTELARQAQRDGFLSQDSLERMGDSEHGGSYWSSSPLVQPEIRRIENLHKVFAVVAEHPVLLPMAKLLVRFESLAPLFSAVYQLHQRRVVARRRQRDGF